MKLVTKTDGMIALIRLQEVSDTRSLEQILENHRIWNHKVMFPVHVAAIKLPDCGTCSVIWDCADGYEHVSVSPQKRYNVPTWNDMCTLKDIFFDDEEEAYQIHPKKSQYVNGVENCLHLWKPLGHEIDELVTKYERRSIWITEIKNQGIKEFVQCAEKQTGYAKALQWNLVSIPELDIA